MKLYGTLKEIKEHLQALIDYYGKDTKMSKVIEDDKWLARELAKMAKEE